MNRLHHIEETLIKNIVDNEDYPNLEFVLLDYNSTDGLEKWVSKRMKKYMDLGIFNYYKNPEPKYFHHSHAKNMALRLGNGDIICSLDADNYTGRDFAFYIHQKMKEADFLMANNIVGRQLVPMDVAGTCGRLTTFKKIFYSSGGYDEVMKGWGWEDIDLNRRLFALGYKGLRIELRYLKCISHDDEDRAKNLQDKNLGKDDVTMNTDGSFQLKSGTCLNNYQISEENLNKGNYVANNGNIGCGRVYKNFDQQELILEKIS